MDISDFAVFNFRLIDELSCKRETIILHCLYSYLAVMMAAVGALVGYQISKRP